MLYAINSNLALYWGLSQTASTSKTILLFEVEGNNALVTDPEEGASLGPGAYRLMSATGDGIKGLLLDAPTPWIKAGDGRFTLDATGIFDNAGSGDDGDDYKDTPGRHRDGFNFLAHDGHSAWTSPKRVSAGRTSASSSDAQRETGCVFVPGGNAIYPCAEGTTNGLYLLTFSAN